MGVVLIVEDDPDLLPIVSEALAEEGWTVLGAPSAKSALEMARSAEIDIVLADITLPDDDGQSLEMQLRETPNAGAPVVFMTGSFLYAKRMAPRPVLLKPFEGSQAAEVLRAVLSAKPRRAPRSAERALEPPLAGRERSG
jgi:DNA-binding response OmpR family regulator